VNRTLIPLPRWRVRSGDLDELVDAEDERAAAVTALAIVSLRAAAHDGDGDGPRLPRLRRLMLVTRCGTKPLSGWLLSTGEVLAEIKRANEMEEVER
jgi:hypothetical protein